MAANRPREPRLRPRRGSIARPVNARLYRDGWLFVALPLLLLAFTVARPGPVTSPTLPPSFDRQSALQLAQDLARLQPDRRPGSLGAVRWFRDQLRPYGLRVREDDFVAEIPGRGRVTLRNLVAVVPGRSPQSIVLMAHRDNGGSGPGANDNASGTAALIEVARSYSRPLGAGGGTRAPRVRPAHTLVFLSTDGGTAGSLGARRFARARASHASVLAAVNLDSIAGGGEPRVVITGDRPRSPAAALVATAAAHLAGETGREPRRAGALAQLVDLAYPFSLYEQAPLVGQGIPAITITTAGDRPPSSFGDTPGGLDGARLEQVGSAVQGVLVSLDQGLELAQGSSAYLYLGPRAVRGWALELVLIAMLVPFLAAAVDLFARCRRRRIPIAPALRSYRSRAAFWLWGGAVFGLFAVTGVWPRGAAVPVSPESSAAGNWPVLGLTGLALLMGLGWLVVRGRLLPRRPSTAEEELAGHTAALLVLGVLALLVVATNPFALVLVLPSLHAWLWLPQVRGRPAWARGLVLAAGFLGPLLLLWSFADRYRLGLDALWYLAELTALGYTPLALVLVFLGWAAAAGQVAALAGGRYAPYPSANERPPRGPIRETVRRVVIARRSRRAERPRALEG
jgi:peptidase M28-like protein